MSEEYNEGPYPTRNARRRGALHDLDVPIHSRLIYHVWDQPIVKTVHRPPPARERKKARRIRLEAELLAQLEVNGVLRAHLARFCPCPWKANYDYSNA